MATVGETLKQVRALSGKVEKGRAFEQLFLRVAQRAPELEIEKIWSWSRWPGLTKHGFDGKDIGIDLVAETKAGTRVAIQCKCYDENYKVSRDDVRNFITAASRETFPLRWFVATCDYGPAAQTVIKNNGIRVIDFGSYHALDLESAEPSREPWPLQQEAIAAVLDGYKESGRDRGRLIMACGTGKTFTALRIVEDLGARTILFIAPSIALVAQTRREWLRHSRRPLACTVICSDRTAGAAEDASTTEISCETTTDPARIAAAIKAAPPETVRAVFCTYQSLDKLSEAQREHGAPQFDIAIVDEAHRTTGYLDETRAGQFQIIHDDEKIAASKRLYMTATPRIYEVKRSKQEDQVKIVDMNDVETYGTEFYRLSFKKAVEAGMLCDYRVIALGITEDTMSASLKERLATVNDDIGGAGRKADDQAFLALGAIALAINGIVEGKNTPGVLRRTITYASNIRRSKWLERALGNTQLKSWITRASRRRGEDAARAAGIVAEHLDGTSTALQRNTALRALNSEATETQPRLITNAQLFTEGVDVPALNAIAFLDPRQSKVDTIQAVGRVMRRDDASGKVLGYIVVPVILPPDADLLETLTEDQSRFKSLGHVLRALQSHDERLYTELTDRLNFANVKPKPDDHERVPGDDYNPPVQLSLLEEDAKQEIYAQLAAKTGISQRGKIIADAITQAIEKSARIFRQEGVTSIIARTIGTPSDNEEESCKTAALLIVNACIMHKRLEQSGNLGGLTHIDAANRVADPSSALSAAWLTILDKDYAPVFQDAVALLQRLPKTKAIAYAITNLIQCAIDNATTLNELGFDHAGPLYHSVLGSAQSDGAFYTKNLSAYLLAGLAFDENFIDWSDAGAVENLKVIDPACGTGSLLMATLNIIKKRAAAAQNLDEAGINALHKKLVERAIYGFDINKYSVQLAACNLTIGAPNTDYERMNLHTLIHGPVPETSGDTVGTVRHGALEKLLDQDMSKMEQVLQPPPPVYGTSVANKNVAEVAMPDKFDAVVYNPPFTDTQKQSKRYGEQVKNAMVERLQFIRSDLAERDPKAAASIGKRSIRPYFTPLTANLLPEHKGRLAKIIPTTACTSENGRAERQYIASKFHVEMVVTSHDPKHVNFSESTSIHECLVIGSRGDNTDNKPTRFVQLAAYPKNVKEADELIAAITAPPAGRQLPYAETLWSADKVRAGDWSPLQWFNPALATTADEINGFSKLTMLGNIGSVDHNEVAFRLNFDYERTDEGGNSFCTIAEGVRQTIDAKPESAATAKPGKERRAELLWGAKASRFLITSRFSTTSSRLTAIHSATPALGSGYVAVVVGARDQEKVFAAFLNSSFGVIQLLHRRTKKLTYPSYEASHLKTLMLPDPAKADLAPLLEAFELVKNTPLQRLAQCAEDPARKILDHAAARAIGMDPALTDQWRAWLSQEPTITNKPYAGEN